MADLDLDALIQRIANAVERDMVPFVVMIPIAPHMLRDQNIENYASMLAGRAMREEINSWRADNANTN